jgi:GPH family glycoside/pentoside/hexuronide:cation symporter
MAVFGACWLVFVVNGVAAALPATLVLFFVADVLHAEAWSGAFLALYFVSGVAFLPLWVALARRFGRVPTWVASMFVAVASFAWAGGLGAGDVWPFAVVCLLSGAALGADLTLPAALLADLAESPTAGGQQSARRRRPVPTSAGGIWSPSSTSRSPRASRCRCSIWSVTGRGTKR